MIFFGVDNIVVCAKERSFHGELLIKIVAIDNSEKHQILNFFFTSKIFLQIKHSNIKM